MKKGYLKPEEKKQKRNIFAILFLFFMIVGLSSSFVFFGFNAGGESVAYGDYTFKNRGDRWETKIDKKIAAFTFPPETIAQFPLDAQVSQALQGKFQIDTTSSINDTLGQAIALAEYQMSLTLSNFNVFIRPGFLTNDSIYPKITCEDATPFVPVIIFKQANATKTSIQNNCILAEVKDDYDTLLLKDRLVMSILGIKQ